MPTHKIVPRMTRRANAGAVLRPIRSKREHVAVSNEIAGLSRYARQLNKREYDRLELLSILVDAYEEENIPLLGKATPQEVVTFMSDQHHMEYDTLARILGGPQRTALFFERKRTLSIKEVSTLRNVLHIPADLLIE